MKTLAIVLFILLSASSSAFAQAETNPDSILVEVWIADNLKNIIIAGDGEEVSYQIVDQTVFSWIKNNKGSIQFLFLTKANKRNKELAKFYLPNVDLRGIASCCVIHDSLDVVKSAYPLQLIFPSKCPAKWVKEVPYFYSCFYLTGKEKEIIEQENIFISKLEED